MPEYLEGFEIPKVQLPIVFVVDTSGSMAGLRLVQLNSALQELSYMLKSLADQIEVQLSIRLIEFNTTARWVIGNTENSVEHLEVHFSEASGLTNTGEALRLARSVMNHRCFIRRSLKPVLFLITDGQSIDPQDTFEAIDELKRAFGCNDKILRIAFEIGDEWIPELEIFASQVDDNPLIFKVDDLGHISDMDMLRKVLGFHCNPYAYDHVSPYDDPVPSFSDDSEWDDEWEE